MTWGAPDDGGDSSKVQDELKDVQQLQATTRAFAAILADGSVVTWGHCWSICQVEDQLRNVRQVRGTGYAFAALRSDGSLVAWGKPMCGGEFKTNVIDIEIGLSRLVR